MARTRSSVRRCIARRPGDRGRSRRRGQLQGPDATYNDLLDLDAAWRTVSDFSAPTCCIAKQLNPVGLASDDTLLDAYRMPSRPTRSPPTARSSP